MVFRYLRTLEGVSPPLALSHLTCQTTAKAFIATCMFVHPDFPHNNFLFINVLWYRRQCSIVCSRSAYAGAARTPPRSVLASRLLQAWPARRSPDVISCTARSGRRTLSHRAGSDITVARLVCETPKTGALGLFPFFGLFPLKHLSSIVMIFRRFIFVYLYSFVWLTRTRNKDVGEKTAAADGLELRL
jgi:hypothetical protein